MSCPSRTSGPVPPATQSSQPSTRFWCQYLLRSWAAPPETTRWMLWASRCSSQPPLASSEAAARAPCSFWSWCQAPPARHWFWRFGGNQRREFRWIPPTANPATASSALEWAQPAWPEELPAQRPPAPSWCWSRPLSVNEPCHTLWFCALFAWVGPWFCPCQFSVSWSPDYIAVSKTLSTSSTTPT